MMDHSNSKRSPGQPFKPPPARVWNDMVAAGEKYRDEFLSQGAPERNNPRPTDIIKARNMSCGNRRRGEVLAICEGDLISQMDPDNLWVNASTPFEYCCFGILRWDSEDTTVGDEVDGEIQELQTSGNVLALVNITSLRHTFATVVPGSFVLRSADEGPVAILHRPQRLGQQECLVQIQVACLSKPTTTTNGRECVGSCKFEAIEAGGGLTWSRVSNGCDTTTTTSTTTTAGDSCGCPTPVTYETTTTTSDQTTTSTTSTTTTGDCKCLWPTFCPTEAAQCTFTSCAVNENSQPTCEPTTTTTCDCATTTTLAGDCESPCTFTAIGGSLCTDGTGGCNCPPGVLPVQCSDVGGSSEWIADKDLKWRLVANNCTGRCCDPLGSGLSIGSPSPIPPSFASSDCGSGGAGGCTCFGGDTATTPEQFAGDCRGPCAVQCYGCTSTTSTTTTGPCVKSCKLKWDGDSWNDLDSECVGPCYCFNPGYDGEETCHVVEVPCGPTTTTTTSTTTTCSVGCGAATAGYAYFQCQNGTWVLRNNNCNAGQVPQTPSATCDNSLQCICNEPICVTTTTTTPEGCGQCTWYWFGSSWGFEEANCTGACNCDTSPVPAYDGTTIGERGYTPCE